MGGGDGGRGCIVDAGGDGGCIVHLGSAVVMVMVVSSMQVVDGGWLTQCHAPNGLGTVDIGIISPAFQKLKSFFKNIFISLKHLELRKREIVDVIPRTGYYEFKKDSDANDMTVQQYYREMYNIHIK